MLPSTEHNLQLLISRKLSFSAYFITVQKVLIILGISRVLWKEQKEVETLQLTYFYNIGAKFLI